MYEVCFLDTPSVLIGLTGSTLYRRDRKYYQDLFDYIQGPWLFCKLKNEQKHETFPLWFYNEMYFKKYRLLIGKYPK